MFTSLLPMASLYSSSATVFDGILLTVLFAALGITLMLVAFKLIDFVTPGKLGAEIIEKRNVAASILAGSLVIGVALIISAALVG